QLRVQLPHFGAQFGSKSECRKRILGAVATGAPMTDAEGQFRAGLGPAETAGEAAEVPGQSRAPSSAKTMILSPRAAQDTACPTATSLRTGWIERNMDPSGSLTS